MSWLLHPLSWLYSHRSTQAISEGLMLIYTFCYNLINFLFFPVSFFPPLLLFPYLIPSLLCLTVAWWMRWTSQAWSWMKHWGSFRPTFVSREKPKRWNVLSRPSGNCKSGSCCDCLGLFCNILAGIRRGAPFGYDFHILSFNHLGISRFGFHYILITCIKQAIFIHVRVRVGVFNYKTKNTRTKV